MNVDLKYLVYRDTFADTKLDACFARLKKQAINIETKYTMQFARTRTEQQHVVHDFRSIINFIQVDYDSQPNHSA